MDNQKHPIDELFSNKLNQHQEKPSTLSWERLDAQLGPQKKSNKPVWIRVAAMLIGIFGLAFILWRIDLTAPNENTPMMAEQSPAVDQEINPNNDIPSVEGIIKPKEETSNKVDSIKNSEKPQEELEKPKTPVLKSKPSPTEQIQRKERLPDNSLVAESKSRHIEQVPDISFEKDMSLAKLEHEKINMEGLLTDNNTVEKTEETVPYTVRIKSSGISEKPKKEKLVTEIGDKINTLGGLIGKVDKGYADLQDAKNNLFASLISKKEEN